MTAGLVLLQRFARHSLEVRVALPRPRSRPLVVRLHRRLLLTPPCQCPRHRQEAPSKGLWLMVLAVINTSCLQQQQHESKDSSSTLFQENRNRLEILERWRELAIRPSEIKCPKQDVDLLKEEVDDCAELKKRCLSARIQMNMHVPCDPETRYSMHLVAKPSTIPHAGLGLFFEPPCSTSCPRKIVKGDIVCYYSGHIHNFTSAKSIDAKSYLMAVEGDLLVDPGPCPDRLGRYINDPLNEKFVNCRYEPQAKHYRSAVVATRDIEPNEELFASYGEAYWSQQETMGRTKI